MATSTAQHRKTRQKANVSSGPTEGPQTNLRAEADT